MANFTRGPWTLTHVAGGNFAVQRFELRGMFGDKPNAYPIFQKDCSAIDGATFCASPQDAHLLAAAWDMHEALKAAAKTFRAYEAAHEAKGTVEGAQKAAANAWNARQCEEALAKADGPFPREAGGDNG